MDMDQDLQIEKHYPNVCRFCLTFDKSETSQKIAVDESTIDHFKNLTGLEIQQDTSFQEFSCVACIEEIKKTSLFKSRMIENLQKLNMILERIKKEDVADTKMIDFNTIDIKEEEFIDNLANQSNNFQDFLALPLDKADMNSHTEAHLKSYDKNQLECSVCSKILPSQVSLRRHMNTAHRKSKTIVSSKRIVQQPKNTFICSVENCDRSFQNQKILQKHLKKDHMDLFKQADNIERELKKQNQVKNKALCPDCGQSFNQTSMRRHILRVHEKMREFYCDNCERSFFRKEELLNHLKVHMEPRKKTIPCNECDKMFSCKESLRTHVNAFHLKKSIICCEICGKSFSTNTNYQIHLRSTHTHERSFKCNKCEKSYFSKGDLVKHEIGSHSTPIQCQICSKLFQSKITLRIHNRMSHQEKKFVCGHDNCSKKFSTNHLLEIHRQNQHLGLKKFQCQYCEMRYFKTTDLKRHILSIHMKIKLQCEIGGCKSQFARKETYRNHVLSHHKDIGEENVQMMLQRIRHLQMPKLELNNAVNDVIN